MKRHPTKPSAGGSRSDLERQALIASRALVDRMTVLYRELERMTDTPIALHRALASIGGEPGIPASRLAELLGIQRPAVSHVLKALVARGWIERVRNVEDQRSVRLSVTRQGQAILNATSGKAVGTLQRCVRRLSADELTGLATGLAALLRHLPEPRRAPARAGSRKGGRVPS